PPPPTSAFGTETTSLHLLDSQSQLPHSRRFRISLPRLHRNPKNQLLWRRHRQALLFFFFFFQHWIVRSVEDIENFALSDGTGQQQTLWQSFDFPTDSWLLEKEDGEGSRTKEEKISYFLVRSDFLGSLGMIRLA
ncbi:hypothetical protein LINPERHAP2_LOCUS14180, partial [Linum perenne]